MITANTNNNLPFTAEQMQQVFQTNIIDFAVQHGFEIEKGDKSAVHVKNSGGLFLFKSGRGYYCFTTEKKGNIIDFAKDYFNLNFMEAVEMILNCKAYERTSHLIAPLEKEKNGILILPPKDKNFNRAIAYLTQTRKIDKEIIYAMIRQEKIYQSLTIKDGKEYRNCAFVGYDEHHIPRYCALRGMSESSCFRQDVSYSDKTYGFVMEGTGNRVYEFEAPIDAMSHATLFKWQDKDWEADHRVSEGCLSDKALQRYLKSHPEITEIVFCYDNDKEGKLPDGTPHNHGQVKAEESTGKFTRLGYTTYIQTPKNKDFNMDLKVVHRWVTEQRQIKQKEEREELEYG